MAQYKRLTGKTDDELQRIFEKEMRLGVLSTQNLLYPFPGMQRPIKDKDRPERTEPVPPEPDKDKFHTIDKDLARIFTLDGLPSTPQENHIRALTRLQDQASKYDDRNQTWENGNELLNQNPFLEEYLIMRTVRELRAAVSMSTCPKLLEAQPQIPIATFNTYDARDQIIVISCTVEPHENREDKLHKLRLLLTNIRDFLCVRGFTAVLIDPTPDSSTSDVLENFDDHIRSFSIQSSNGCVILSQGDTSKLTGAVITDAISSDELTLKLLITSYEHDVAGHGEIEQDFVSLIEQFYHIGMEKDFISKEGEVLDEVLYDWYFNTLFAGYIETTDSYLLRNQVENFLEQCILHAKDDL